MNPLHVWNTFWFTKTSAKPLATFRIIFGIVAIANLALLLPDLDFWLSGDGLLQGTEAQEYAGPFRPSILQWYQSPTIVHAIVAFTALAFVGLMVGWHTRVMSVLSYLGMLSIHQRNVASTSGADVLLMVISFYMLLCPSGVAYSLDARRRDRKRATLAEPLIEPWGFRLIQIQLCGIYLITAILKCNGATWLNGTALHFVLNNPEIGRFSLYPLQEYPLAINILTYLGLATEFLLAFALWFRPTRRWAILAGIALHVGVIFTVNIPIFGELMTACYILFLAPDELQAILRAINPRTYLKAKTNLIIPGRVDLGSRPHGPHSGVRQGVLAFAEDSVI